METTINLRIDIDVKLQLEEFANENNMSLSEYLREILIEHIEPYYHDVDEFKDLPKVLVVKDNITCEYEKTYGFTYLLAWLFYKQINPVETNNKEVIKAIKNRVELTINESSFSQELNLEFVKVLNDINRFLVEPDYENKQFVFPISNNHLSFDYYKLINEIWSIKH